MYTIYVYIIGCTFYNLHTVPVHRGVSRAGIHDRSMNMCKLRNTWLLLWHQNGWHLIKFSCWKQCPGVISAIGKPVTRAVATYICQMPTWHKPITTQVITQEVRRLHSCRTSRSWGQCFWNFSCAHLAVVSKVQRLRRWFRASQVHEEYSKRPVSGTTAGQCSNAKKSLLDRYVVCSVWFGRSFLRQGERWARGLRQQKRPSVIAYVA